MSRKTRAKCLVIGAGAVGQGIASFLAQAGEEVVILARGKTARAIRQLGIYRTGALGEYPVKPGALHVAEHLGDLSGWTFDTIFVCVKSFDTKIVADSLARVHGILVEDGAAVLCQNGWGNAEIFSAAVGADRVLNARILTGFERVERTHIDVTVHAQPVRIGSLFSADTELADFVSTTLSRGGLSAEGTSDIARDLWAKMCFNCTVNPLGAIFVVPLGELITCTEMRLIIEILVGEVFDVMHAVGHQTHWPDAQSYLQVFYNNLIPATAGHHSSMLHDVQAGRRTEIDALNGAVVRLGDQANLPVEMNRTVFRLIRFAEAVAEHRRHQRNQSTVSACLLKAG